MRKGLALPAPSTCPSSPPTSGSSWGCSQGALWLGHHPPELGTVRPAGGCAVPEQQPASSSAVPAHSRFGHGCRQRLQARGEHQQLPADSDAQRELPALVQDSQEQQQPRCLLLWHEQRLDVSVAGGWVCSYSSSGVVLPFPVLFWLGPRARVPSPWGHSCCWRRKTESQTSCRHPEGGREPCACARLCSGVLQSAIQIFCSSQPGISRLALLPLLPAPRPARCHPSARSGAICELAKNKQTNTSLALQTSAPGGRTPQHPKTSCCPPGMLQDGAPQHVPPGTRCPWLGCAGAGRGAAAHERWHEPKCPLCSGRHRSGSF